MSDPKLANFFREQRRRIKRKLFPEQRRLRLTKDGDEFVLTCPACGLSMSWRLVADAPAR